VIKFEILQFAQNHEKGEMSSLTNEKTEPIAGKQRHGTSKFLIGSSKKFRAFAPNISNYPSKFPRIPIFIDVLLFDC